MSQQFLRSFIFVLVWTYFKLLKICEFASASFLARDVLANLTENNIRSPADFNWLSQMRYYFDAAGKDVFVHMITTEIAYGYEYLGNSPRLVITPLTDRCYRFVVNHLPFLLYISLTHKIFSIVKFAN